MIHTYLIFILLVIYTDGNFHYDWFINECGLFVTPSSYCSEILACLVIVIYEKKKIVNISSIYKVILITIFKGFRHETNIGYNEVNYCHIKSKLHLHV